LFVRRFSRFHQHSSAHCPPADGEDLSYELKVTASMDNARVVVVRDVTERYRRSRTSECRVLARQQDAKRLIALRDTRLRTASWD
jgi:hypothetical protein